MMVLVLGRKIQDVGQHCGQLRSYEANQLNKEQSGASDSQLSGKITPQTNQGNTSLNSPFGCS